MKDKALKILIWLAVFASVYIYCFNLLAEDFGLTQHLYDQAIMEIEQGHRDTGCRILQDALSSSKELDDNFDTYNQIWAIGTKACNWINNPSAMETISVSE